MSFVVAAGAKAFTVVEMNLGARLSVPDVNFAGLLKLSMIRPGRYVT